MLHVCPKVHSLTISFGAVFCIIPSSQHNSQTAEEMLLITICQPRILHSDIPSASSSALGLIYIHNPTFTLLYVVCRYGRDYKQPFCDNPHSSCILPNSREEARPLLRLLEAPSCNSQPAEPRNRSTSAKLPIRALSKL